MGKLVTGFFALVLIVIAALLVAPALIPVSAYKQQILQQAEAATGRDVQFDDTIGLSLFPEAKLKLNNVVIGNADGGQAPYFAKIGTLDVGVDLFSVFSRNVEVRRFIVGDADINLEADQKGGGNWEFGRAPADPDPGAGPQPGAPRPGAPRPDDRVPPIDPEAGQTRSIENVFLGDIRIENSTVSFRDSEGTVATYSDINLRIGLHSLDEPLRVDGLLVYRQEPVKLNLRVSNPRSLLDGGATEVAVDFDSALATIRFDGSGRFDPAGKNDINGKLAADIASVRRFAAFLGNPIGGSGGFGPLKLSADLAAKGDSVSMRDVDLFFDGMTGAGALSITLIDDQPRVTGTLAVDTLDFNTFTGGGDTAKGGPIEAPAVLDAPPADLDAPIVLAQAQTWSTAPINFGALKSFDARLNLKADNVRFGELKIGKTDVSVIQTGGKMTANLGEAPLYSGVGSGQFVIDAASSTPTVSSTFQLSAAEMLPFLRDAVGFDKIEGLGSLTYTLTTSGVNERQLIGNLRGSGMLSVVDGAYRGVDLAAMARAIDSFVSLGLGDADPAEGQEAGQESVGGRQKTDFAELSGTYTIDKGIVRNSDLKLLNPFVRVTGAGSVDLPRQTISYRLVPRAVGSIEGQGGEFLNSGIAIPILVTGPLDNPKFAPDYGAAIGSALIGSPDGSGEAPLERLLNKALGIEEEKEQPTDAAPSDNPPTETETDPVEQLFDLLREYPSQQ